MLEQPEANTPQANTHDTLTNPPCLIARVAEQLREHGRAFVSVAVREQVWSDAAAVLTFEVKITSDARVLVSGEEIRDPAARLAWARAGAAAARERRAELGVLT